jgi:hypothetical protein
MPILKKQPATAAEVAARTRKTEFEPLLPLPGIRAWLGALKVVSVLAGAGFIAKLAHEQMLGIQLSDWSVLDLSLFAGRWVVDTLTSVLSALASDHYLGLTWILLGLLPTLAMMFAQDFPAVLRAARIAGIGLAAIALSFVIVHYEVPTFGLNNWLTDNPRNLSTPMDRGRLGSREEFIRYVYFVSKTNVDKSEFEAIQAVALAYLQKEAQEQNVAKYKLAQQQATGTQQQTDEQELQTAEKQLQDAVQTLNTAKAQLDSLSVETAELFPYLVRSRPLAATDASDQLSLWYSRAFLICAIALLTCFIFVFKGGHDLEEEILSGCYYFTAFVLLPVSCALLPYVYGKLICVSNYPQATVYAMDPLLARSSNKSDAVPHEGVLIGNADQEYMLLFVQSGATQTHIFSEPSVQQIKISTDPNEDIVNYVLTQKADISQAPMQGNPASQPTSPKESQP